jgi:hypothetical protein
MLRLICDKNASIVYVGNLYFGGNVEWTIFKKELLCFNFEQLKIWVDLGGGCLQLFRNKKATSKWRNLYPP